MNNQDQLNNEEQLALYIRNNPNCSWEEVKEEFKGGARKEVFRIAKRELKKNRVDRILEKLEDIFDQESEWEGPSHFEAVCIKNGIPAVQKRSINRFFNRAQSVRNIIHSI